mgnify:CR=1 FL=1
MFDIGDIIKHKREDKYYMVVEIKTYFNVSLERIEYTVIGDGEGQTLILHHPLMTANYEKI